MINPVVASKDSRCHRLFPCLLVWVWLAVALAADGALTHRWSFSEASGTNLVDSVGGSNGWVVVNGATDYSRGAGYVRLAGGAWASADFIQMPPGMVSMLTNVTVEVWATPRSAQNWSRIFDFGAGNGTVQANDFYLSFCIGTSLNAQRMEHDPTPMWRVDTGLATTANTPYHYVVTWSKTGGPSGGGLAAWYRDGVLAGSTDTGTRSVTNVNDTVMWLGRSQFTSDNVANADYNEIRIYSHALGTNEINFSHVNGPDNYVAPPAQASAFTMTTNSTTFTLMWTLGAGSAGSIVLMRAGAATSLQPNYGTNYTGSNLFGNGANLGGSNFVVFAGAGSSVTVTNVTPGVQYFAAVYSYSGSGASTVYNLADAPTASRFAFGAVQSVALTVSSPLPLGSSAQSTVLANYGGVFVDVTAAATFSAGNTNIVTVSTNGKVQSVSFGSTTVIATYQTFSTTNTVTVVDPLVNNLRHRYPFSTDATDVYGTANGTLVGGASIVNNQLLLDGASGYVSLPAGIMATYTNFTIEAWVSNTVSSAWARIMDFGTGTAVNMFITPTAGGGPLRFAITVNSYGAEQQVTAPAALPVNVLKHVVVTLNNGVGILYLDGVAQATNSVMTLTPASLGSTTQNYIGKSQYADPYFAGALEEFRIYDAPLPANLVLTNFLAGPNGLAVAPPTVVNDFVTLNPGAKVLIAVLTNDQSGTPPLASTLQLVSAPVNGTAVVNTNSGKILYTHNGSATLSDSLTYRVQNYVGSTSAVATVSIIINPSLRLANTTLAMPSAPPATGYQVVDAFPGLTVAQPLALVTPRGAAYASKLFIVERRGYVSYIDVTVTNPVRQVFLDISNQLAFDNSATDGELGLLGMEFHPGFATNGIFFTAYIASGGNPYMVRLSRFTANPTNLTVNTNTQVMLFQTTKSEFNHNGCDLHFGNDGYLYMSMGDEGNQYNYHTNAQKLDKSLYSGILRIDVDKKPGNLEPKPPQTASNPILTIPLDGLGKAYYSIPSDNPFLGVTNLYGVTVNTNFLRGEFYCIGMRHCWRFSIDPVTGEIWAGVVGQDLYEEVDLVKKGGNYGWPYYEGTHLTVSLYGGAPTHPGLTNPPAGFVRDGPTWEYPHNSVSGADPSFAGLDVCGSLPYRGSRIGSLTNAYLFGDFDTGGNIWALRRPTTNTVTVERIGGQTGLSAFGADPSNGDPLFCNYLQNKIQRLVVVDTSGSTFPQKLSDTGAFADLATLTPNPGIISYEPNVTFWSDYASKRRWFALPDSASTFGFAADANWTLPAGAVWVKHFDMEMTRGNPATKRRIETRFLVKTTNSIYGVSYRWNDRQDEAYLTADGGDLFNLTITNAGVPTTQVWEIPSRSSCLSCHTAVGGYALSFNTRQFNRTNTMNGVTGNQIDLMSSAGYFNSTSPAAHFLPAFANATNSSYSLEYRVRSYLAVNCVQCHQPGGAGPPSWDARPWLTLAQTMIVNGLPVANNGNNPANKIIVPGDPNHSVILLRLQNTNGFSRMPPLATHVLDPNAISLVQNWIANELPAHLTYAQWLAQYPTLSGANTNSTADPDGDGANNYLEYLTGTSPTNAASYWKPFIAANQNQVAVGYNQVANVGIVIETSSDLLRWSTWNVPGNDPIYGLLNGTNVLVGMTSTNQPMQFFRAKILEP